VSDSVSSRVATREEGLRLLEGFVLRAGRDYARNRNVDLGPGRRDNVSGLSPWIRHRLLLEEEAVEVAAEAHGLDAAEKFVQEVCWRTYWKGWLETRPRVWSSYLQQTIGNLNGGAGCPVSKEPRQELWRRTGDGAGGSGFRPKSPSESPRSPSRAHDPSCPVRDRVISAGR
jgi:hypothetical protein